MKKTIQSPRLQLLERDIHNFGSSALKEFWGEIERRGAPIIEPGADDYSLVTFLWRDDG